MSPALSSPPRSIDALRYYQRERRDMACRIHRLRQKLLAEPHDYRRREIQFQIDDLQVRLDFMAATDHWEAER